MDGGLQLQDVLGGLNQEDVGATVGEAADLVEKEVHDLREARVAEHRVLGGGEETGGADGAGDEAGPIRGGVGVRNAASKLGGGAVLLVGALAEAVLLQLQLGAAEGVGFDDVDADLEEGGVDGLDKGGVVEDEVLVAALDAAVAGGVQVVGLDGGAHGAVVEDHALADEVKEVAAALVGGKGGSLGHGAASPVLRCGWIW